MEDGFRLSGERQGTLKQRAELYLDINKPELAVESALGSLRENNKDAESYCILAKAYNKLEEFFKAENAILEALQLQPQNDYYHYVYAIILWNLQDNGEEEFKRAIELNCYVAYYYSSFAAHLIGIFGYERSHEAEEFCYRALELEDFNTQAHNILALIHMHRGQLWDAEREYLQSLKEEPNEPQVLNDYGVLLLRMESVKKGREVILQSLALDPMNSNAERNLLLSYKLDYSAFRFYYKFRNKIKSGGLGRRLLFYVIFIVLPYIPWLIKDFQEALRLPVYIFSIVYILAILGFIFGAAAIGINARQKLLKRFF